MLRVRPNLLRRFNSTRADFESFIDKLIPEQTPTADEEMDILGDFINKELEVEERKSVPFKQTDFDGLKSPEDSEIDNLAQVVKEEKELFQYIFESYMKPAKKKEEPRTSPHMGSLVQRRTTGLSEVSVRLKVKMFEECKKAMGPTLAYIEAIETRDEMVAYFDGLVERQQSVCEDPSIFLRHLFRTSNMKTEHTQFVEDLGAQCSRNPSECPINVLTLPIMVNQVLQTLAYKFRDGQLALTLFNVLKRDVGLYTFACNQETFNQMLRIAWVYGGKSSLHAIEMLFYEMRNNGFPGDFRTFAILKQVVLDYHAMKMGKGGINKNTFLPLWSVEDDKRVRALEGRMEKLARMLR